MSLCICFQNNEGLMIAADTAMVISHKGRRYRFRQPYQKLVSIDRFLIFMSGVAATATNVMNKFRQSPIKDATSFRDILVEECAKCEKLNSDKVNSLDPFDEIGTAALLAEWAEDGVIVHTLQPKDGFEVHTFRASSTETIPHAGGVSSAEALEIVGKWLSEPVKTMSMGEIIQDTFEKLSGGNVGGALTAAVMNKQGISFLPPAMIKEKVQYPYYEDMLIRNGTLIGSQISTSEQGVYPRADMSSSDRIFSVRSSPSMGIEMRSIGTNALSEFRFINGSSQASMSYPGGSTGLYLNGDNLTMEFMNIYLRGYNSIQVIDWAQLKNGQTGISMDTELQNVAHNMTFDSTTRNLKLWSRGGSLLAQVNIPK
ncbi:hypothetical protein D3C74_270050 [compost metagenome]